MALTPTQRGFVTSKEPFPCFCGGFGSGKTAAGIARAMILKALCRKQDIAYYLPTFPLVEDIALKRFPELCERKGWEFNTRSGNTPHIEFPGAGKIIFRTMEKPERIVGYEVAHSIVDELDTLQKKKAKEAWQKIIARNRQKCHMRNTVGVVTTPEGYRFVYEKWKLNPLMGYVLFQAKTQDNLENLPEGYIDNLLADYPPHIAKAYLDGEFCNMTSGAVYPDFDRVLNGCDTEIQAGDVLHIGMDFNIQNMTAVVTVQRAGELHVVEEIVKARDTPHMCAIIKERYFDKGHQIVVYPDASGGSASSKNSSESDYSIIRSFGYMIRSSASNPPVRDRVNSVNAMILNSLGARRLKVNTLKCPTATKSLEQQAYDKFGAPDKGDGTDHSNDALGYRVMADWALKSRSSMVSAFPA